MLPPEQSKGALALFFHHLSDRANRVSEAGLFVFMLVMLVVTTLQVVFRFFFTALSWSEEMSCFLLVFVSLLGTAVAFKRGSHIAITFLIDRVPPVTRKILLTFIQFLGLVFFGIVSFYGAGLMRAEATQLTPAMQISMKWVYLMYPLIGVVIMLHMVDALIRIWEREAG